jgi:hypothetical protein
MLKCADCESGVNREADSAAACLLRLRHALLVMVPARVLGAALTDLSPSF